MNKFIQQLKWQHVILNRYFWLLWICLLGVTVSCKKFEEDRGIRLTTVYTRLTTNAWELKKYVVNGIDSAEYKNFIAKRYVFTSGKRKTSGSVVFFEKDSKGGRYYINQWTYLENLDGLYFNRGGYLPGAELTPFYTRTGEFKIKKMGKKELIMENHDDSTGTVLRLEFTNVKWF